jgi:hypothetical protein
MLSFSSLTSRRFSGRAIGNATSSSPSKADDDREVEPSSSEAPPTTAAATKKAPPMLLLYERTPDNYALMRTGFGFSTFHTAYWLWYNADFIPTVNASQMHELHIDPALGIAGFVFAVAIQAVFYLYPKRLVSKIELRRIAHANGSSSIDDDDDDDPRRASSTKRGNGTTLTTLSSHGHELLIYTHTLPFITPSSSPTIVPVGKVLLDPHSSELHTVIHECDGNLGLFRGTLGFGHRWPPYLLDVRDSSNVPRPYELLCALLYPTQLLHVGPSDDESGNARSRRPSRPGGATAAKSLPQRRHHPRNQQPKRNAPGRR